jgi:hypothetical protein
VLTCGIKLPRSSTTGLSSGGGGAVNIRGAPTMVGVERTARVAGGEVVEEARSNVESVTTKSRNITPSVGEPPTTNGVP